MLFALTLCCPSRCSHKLRCPRTRCNLHPIRYLQSFTEQVWLRFSVHSVQEPAFRHEVGGLKFDPLCTFRKDANIIVNHGCYEWADGWWGLQWITCSAIIQSPSKERRMSQATVHRYTLIVAGKLSILIIPLRLQGREYRSQGLCARVPSRAHIREGCSAGPPFAALAYWDAPCPLRRS